MLNTVIGLVFLYLLLSLLSTAIMELISGLLQLRGKMLVQALRKILSHDSLTDKLWTDFINNPFFQQLSPGFFAGKNSKLYPSYISAKSFVSTLLTTIQSGDLTSASVTTAINDLPQSGLRTTLLQMWNEVEQDVEKFKTRLENWFNDVMDRVSGWYKRKTQIILIAIGACIVLSTNANTINIYEKLSNDPQASANVAQLAANYLNANPKPASPVSADTGAAAVPQSTPAPARQSPRDSVLHQDSIEIKYNLVHAIANDVRSLSNPLGLGYPNGFFAEFQKGSVVTLILGWILTALAISLGAPFWFDLLKLLVNIRSTGAAPGEKK